MVSENLSGPQVDRFGFKTTYFMYVDSAGLTTDEVVAFESPIYNSQQHRVECFHFYVALTVKFSTLYSVLLFDKCKYSKK